MQKSTRLEVELKTGWRLFRGDHQDGADVALDDSDWEIVDVPHDAAIGGAFDRAADLQRTRVLEDGERKERDHTGRTGGLPHVGQVWYRRVVHAPSGAAIGSRVLIEFDGVMSHSAVYMNGVHVGGRPNGYISFVCDVTDAFRFGEKNVLAVRVDNKPHASRWYPGLGIYRNVRLIVKAPVHIAHWGTKITTPEVSERRSTVRIEVAVTNTSHDARDVELAIDILDMSGQSVARASKRAPVASQGEHVFDLSLTLTQAKLWSVESPHLYTAVQRVLVDERVVDQVETRFGIRDIAFDADNGFRINGRRVQFKGVCLHHDLGSLGAAVNVRATERRLELLKEMGCNAIRTSHNPPDPGLLDLCDSMGFLVIDEAFDEWRDGKVPNGYSTIFDEWAETDLRDMIRRDRNHPSVVMWSIGNEVREQRRENGKEVAQFLTSICHDEDPTRPVTAGFNAAEAAIANGLADVVDIVGWNYEHDRYHQHRSNHPNWVVYGSETESCVSSRGEYYLPVRHSQSVRRPSLHCNAYDTEATRWGCPAEVELAAQEANPYLLGQFTWTGFDYLGEPTPYYVEWPSRSSYFGILDLCGFPKDRYFLYRSVWSDEPTLHLFPHWNWEGHEGRVIPVHCFTSFDAAELFLNGRSLGVRRKARTRLESQDPAGDGEHLGWPFTRFRLMWDVPYEPGMLTVVAHDDKGRPVMEKSVITAGQPAKIELVPDRSSIKADGEDLSFVTVKITDKAGNVCPRAENRVAFQIEGPGTLAAIDNGDPTSLEPFVGTNRRAFHGLCLATVRSRRDEVGRIRLSAAAEGLEGATVEIETTRYQALRTSI